MCEEQHRNKGGEAGAGAGAAEDIIASYGLCGVVMHHGEHAKSGHYTAVTRHGDWDQEKWVHYDDGKATLLTASTALSYEEEVYILIYSLKRERETEMETETGVTP